MVVIVFLKRFRVYIDSRMYIILNIKNIFMIMIVYDEKMYNLR